MEQIQNKSTSTKKRSLKSHEESSSTKGMKKWKLKKTEPKMEAESKETRLKKDMEFKEKGQKLTEKERSKKVLLKKLQKLRKLGENPMGKTAMTNVKMEAERNQDGATCSFKY